MPRAPQTPQKAVGEPSPTPRERLKYVKRTPELEIAIGARIRTARVAARMSQDALATAIGVSYQQMQKYELGKDRVAASTLQGIAAALGVHPGSFFDADMPTTIGSIPDVKQATRSADVLGQIRDPRVLRHLLALAKVLAGMEDDQPPAASNRSP